MEKITNKDENRVDASPTKDFFISMLVRDIGLIRAIIDLVDNCLDGARRLRESQDYSGLWVRIEAAKDQFKISDNCGGIPVEIARSYAFRFGRPKDMPPTLHSVGQFGVGMKRALFKLGKEFTVESKTDTSHFLVEVDVEEWKKEDKKWEFKFKILEDPLPEITPEVNRGTTITVASLHESIAEEFDLENFQNRLRAELEAAHEESLTSKLQITLNGVPLEFRVAQLLHSDGLRPAFQEMEFEEAGRPMVKVKIYAGVSESRPSAAGWYVYCNGRSILEADQTMTTGWGAGEETTIPKYHNQFARFRGYVFFDCDDAERLPWNTTKTGVDVDARLFRSVRQKMITMMRPVIDFLNRLDAEKSPEVQSTPLTDGIEEAQSGKLQDVQTSDTFTALQADQPPTLGTKRERRIQYSKPSERIEKVRTALRVSTLKEVGEGTFDYYYKMECED